MLCHRLLQVHDNKSIQFLLSTGRDKWLYVTVHQLWLIPCHSFCNPNLRNTYEYSILVYSCTGSTVRACRNSATPSVHHGGRPFFYPASSLSAYCSLSQHQPLQQSLYPWKENRKWARNDQFHAWWGLLWSRQRFWSIQCLFRPVPLSLIAYPISLIQKWHEVNQKQIQKQWEIEWLLGWWQPHRSRWWYHAS